ncbi:MBOAT family O-acyltransferase [Emticicia aquatilis]|nr:MBOAT family O-acyltransferase [Emticicia aquatilis]
MFSTLLDYFTALQMQYATNQNERKFWFWLSIVVNLGFLGIFKYFNFFSESFANTMSYLGWQINPLMIKVVLPVGISFYTFHGLSYVIDIYKQRIQAEKNFVDYAVFVSFFPLLVAGPIERATHLLPQIKKERKFEYLRAVDGLRQILWGLFKKVVIADKCAIFANQAFNNSGDMNGSTLFLGAIFFTFQIYGDFSGYSDIALGTARLFGIDLLRNFAYPYFSRDIAEFWRRWHISLSSWFKDYLYFPLGGSKGGNWMRIRNTFIIFIVSGFWHGANWTFITWGALNALFILPSVVLQTNRNNIDIVAKGRSLPTITELTQMLLTFTLTIFAWIFFRAENISHALNYISDIFSSSLFSTPKFDDMRQVLVILILIVLFMLIEWTGREDLYAIEKFALKYKRSIRYIFYYIIISAIFISILLSTGKEQQFIYFQF